MRTNPRAPGAGSTSGTLLGFLDDLNPECEGEIFPLRSAKLWPKLLTVPCAEKIDIESRTSRNRSDIRAWSWSHRAISTFETGPRKELVAWLRRQETLLRQHAKER
jgi:hypothetical protein